MLVGIFDENGKKYGAEDCICKYKELSEVYCPVNGHMTFYRMKIPSVTQLIGTSSICPRKTWFDYNYPVYQFYKSIYPLMRGKLHHKALLSEVKIKELGLIDKVNGQMWGGTLDAYDPCSGVLYEVKTTRSLPYKVKPWDFLQVELYDYLLKKYGYVAKSYRIMYFTYEEYRQFDMTPTAIPEDVVSTLVEDTAHHIGVYEGSYKQAWSCLAEGTLILTERGWIPVDTALVGDRVLSSDGKFHTITNVMSRPKDREMVTLKPYFLPPITLTHDHRVLVRRWPNCSAYHFHPKYQTETYSEQWIPVAEIGDWDRLVYIVDGREMDIPSLTPADLGLIGYYLAEGNMLHMRPDGGYYKTQFTLASEETDIAEDIKASVAERFPGVTMQNHVVTDKRKSASWRNVRVFSKDVSDFIKKYVHGGYANDKYLDESIMLLPQEKQRILLEKAIKGDGWIGAVRDIPITVYTTTSRVLAHQIQQIAMRLGYAASIVSQIMGESSYGAGNVVYHVRWHQSSTYGYFEDNKFIMPVQNIERNVEYDGLIYDLTVDGSHDFLTEGGIVHNCAYCAYSRWCPLGIKRLKEYDRTRNFVIPPAMNETDTVMLTTDEVLAEPMRSDVAAGLIHETPGGRMGRAAPTPSPVVVPKEEPIQTPWGPMLASEWEQFKRQIGVSR